MPISTLTVLLPWVAAVAGLVALGLSLFHLVDRRRLAALAERQRTEQRRLRGHLVALHKALRGSQQRQARLRDELKWTRERLEQLELGRPRAEGYRRAIRLAARGKGQGDLIESCGLTASEAELLLRLHPRRAKRRPAQPSGSRRSPKSSTARPDTSRAKARISATA